MALTGGYKIIDLHDVNLVVDGSPVKIPGVYEAIESNYRKATILSGMTLNGVERPDRWVNFGTGSDGAFHASIGLDTDAMILYITVTNEDMVSLTEM